MSKILSDNLSQELVSKESMAEDLAVEIKSLGIGSGIAYTPTKSKAFIG